MGELLTLSRLESAANSNEKDHFDINGLVNAVADDARFEAQSQNRQVVFNGTHEQLMHGNMELLRRAVENVVRNAIYYTPENTDVIISIEGNNNYITLTVRDSGNGVAEDKLSDLFQPFVRISESAQNITTPGYGLGLAIAKRAVEIHKGSIKAYNHASGGLCIEIQLPV